MPDYIEREAAIIGLRRWSITADRPRTWMNAIDKAVEVIEAIPAADVRPVVTCAKCEHNNACLTQAFAEDCGKIPLDRNTFFCADGERSGNA